MSLVDIHTVGAGGGSLAWLEAGALRVGPQSAGADPGPVCYGRGGTQPTVTDANLFLGRLGIRSLLAGSMILDAEATAMAIHQLAAEIGLSNIAFAEGVLSIINAKMADAIRTITVKQGIDPRQFSMVAFGGAGSMHAVWLAQELEIGEVIVPWSPGTFSAWGMLQADIRRDLVHIFYHKLTEVDPDEIAEAYRVLGEEGWALLQEEAVASDDMYFELTADMRYVGQEYSVKVYISQPRDLPEIEQRFHQAHHTLYGHATPNAPVEFVNLRLAALGRLHKNVPGFVTPGDEKDPVMGTRQVVFDGKALETRILARQWLPAHASFDGPVIIEEQSATTVVPPGYVARLDTMGNILITENGR
jgi:N-methylhydantoinase A